MESFAWVESPLQVLGAVEAHAAGLLGENTTVHGRAGLEPVRQTLAELERTTRQPRGLAIVSGSAGTPRSAGRLALGDALSGQAQRLLLRRTTRDVVLLDDGRATRIMVRCLVDGDPLLRPHNPASASRTVLGQLATRKLRRLAADGRVTVFTSLDLDPDLVERAARLGFTVRRHSFEWLRAQAAPPAPAARTVVLGSALVANDLIPAAHYVRWVAGIALGSGALVSGPSRTAGAVRAAGANRGGPAVAYFAHRREDERTLGPLREAAGLTVHRGELPVELRLRGLTRGHVVHSLPSTAAHTLRLICPGVSVHEHRIDPGWWLPAAGDAVRRHLAVTDPDLADLRDAASSPADLGEARATQTRTAAGLIGGRE